MRLDELGTSAEAVLDDVAALEVLGALGQLGAAVDERGLALRDAVGGLVVSRSIKK